MNNLKVIDIKSLQVQKVNKRYKYLMDLRGHYVDELCQIQKSIDKVNREIKKIEKKVLGDI